MGIKSGIHWMNASRHRRGVAQLTSGTAAGQAILVLSAPVLTRLYDPAVFGVFAVFASILLVATVISAGRLELAITLPKQSDEAKDVLTLASGCVLVFSVLLAAVIFPAKAALAEALGKPALAAAFRILPISVLCAGLGQVFLYWRIRQDRFRSVALSKVAQSLGRVGGQVGLGGMGMTSVGLVGGDVAGRVVGLVVLMRGDGFRALRGSSWAALRAAAKRWRRFPIFSAPSSLINVAGRNAAPLLLAFLYAPAVAGWYALGQRMMIIPTTVFSDPVSQVLYSATSQIDPKDARDTYVRVVVKMAKAGVIPFVVAGLSAPLAFPVVFGPGWRNAGLYVAVLTPMFLAGFVLAPLTTAFALAQRQDLQLIWDSTRLIACVLLLVASSAIGSTPLTAISLFSAMMTILYLWQGMLGLRALSNPHRDVIQATALADVSTRETM